MWRLREWVGEVVGWRGGYTLSSLPCISQSVPYRLSGLRFLLFVAARENGLISPLIVIVDWSV